MFLFSFLFAGYLCKLTYVRTYEKDAIFVYKYVQFVVTLICRELFSSACQSLHIFIKKIHKGHSSKWGIGLTTCE